jgi:hypothetical protein
MDLALHLGGSVESLTRSMTEAELQRWALYSQKRSLPFARLEIMLAQLSMLVARTMGGAKNAKVEDFMLQEISDEELPVNVTRLDAARKAFGFSPRIKRKA